MKCSEKFDCGHFLKFLLSIVSKKPDALMKVVDKKMNVYVDLSTITEDSVLVLNWCKGYLQSEEFYVCEVRNWLLRAVIWVLSYNLWSQMLFIGESVIFKKTSIWKDKNIVLSCLISFLIYLSELKESADFLIRLGALLCTRKDLKSSLFHKNLISVVMIYLLCVSIHIWHWQHRAGTKIVLYSFFVFQMCLSKKM